MKSISQEFASRHYQIWWHEEKNLILNLIPKAGNTTLKAAILEGMGTTTGKEFNVGFKYVTPDFCDYARAELGATEFVFVRNPLLRLQSAYRNIIRDRTDGPKPLRGKSFLEVCSWLRQSVADGSALDKHFRPQADFIRGDMKNARVWKLEDWSDDGWSILCDELREFDIRLPVAPEHLNRTNYDVSHVAHFEIAYTIYREDYKKFGY